MKIALENIKSGDVLLQDVINQNGTLIAAAGSAIDDITLRRFKIWSIKEVDVKYDKVESPVGFVHDPESAAMGINSVMDKILLVADRIKNQRISGLVSK